MTSLHPISIVFPVIAAILAPSLLGVINRVKAIWAGRQGQPVLQPYYDIIKLLGKSAVYSKTTSWVFRAGPVVGLASLACALMVTPFGGIAAPLSFHGDFLFFAYVIGLGRFFTIAAALDTGSAFEGMGSAREALFSAVSEVVLLLCLVALAVNTRELSLSSFLAVGVTLKPALMALVTVSLLITLLAENSRIPIDDPNTHLELTMIHEVMVLDHGGPDLGFIEYARSLKLWITGAIAAQPLITFITNDPMISVALNLLFMYAIAILVGCVESTMARLRMPNVPRLIVGAGALSALAVILALR